MKIHDLNGGKPLMSEKGKWYTERREQRKQYPKHGARTHVKGDKAKLDEGMDRIDWSKKAKKDK